MTTETSWLPHGNLTSIIGLISLGLTAGDLFLRYRTSHQQQRQSKDFSKTDTSILENDDSSKPMNRFGME